MPMVDVDGSSLLVDSQSQPKLVGSVSGLVPGGHPVLSVHLSYEPPGDSCSGNWHDDSSIDMVLASD